MSINGSQIINGGAGAALNSAGESTTTFLNGLVAGIIICSVQVLVYFPIKSLPRFRRFLQPRTYLVPQRSRIKPYPATINPWKWLKATWEVPNSDLTSKCGIDAYLFLRYLRMLLKIFVPTALVLLPILIPINAVGGRSTKSFVFEDGKNVTTNVTGLDALTWQNVAPQSVHRYWAHLILAIILIGWCCFVFYDELSEFVKIRQEYLTSSEHRLRASARTLFVQDIPQDLCNEKSLKKLYSGFEGGIHRVWLNRNLAPLQKKVQARNALIKTLENAEMKLIKAVNKVALKNQAKGQKQDLDSKEIERERSSTDDTTPEDIDRDALWKTFSPKIKRPTIGIRRVKWLPFVHRNVDAIYYCRAELARLNEEISNDRSHVENFKMLNSAFVVFDKPLSAHLAVAIPNHHHPGYMASKYAEIAPREIIWSNVGLRWPERWFRHVFVFICFLALILAWGVPIFFIGILSQLESIRNEISWLSWLRNWNAEGIRLISGVLAPLLLALMVNLIAPLIIRPLCAFLGVPTTSIRELRVQDFYFTFLLIEVVLVTSISSGLIVAVPQIVLAPETTPSILAENFPKASNYFLTYILLQAFSTSGIHLLQTLRLLGQGFSRAGSKTPRQLFHRYVDLNTWNWGSFYCSFTIYACIGLIYAIIAPLILVFNIIQLCFYWVVFRNNLLYVMNNETDTGGQLFPKAVHQTFAGLYLAELCLIGLFFLVKPETPGGVPCKGQGIIMVVVLALTILYQIILYKAFNPLCQYLPVTQEDYAASRDEDAMHLNQEVSHDTITEEGGVKAKEAEYRSSEEVVVGDEEETPLPDKKRYEAINTALDASLAKYDDEISDLPKHEQMELWNRAFTHPTLREPEQAPNSVWLPHDELGISNDEIKRTEEYSRWIKAANKGAFLRGKDLHVEISQPPPDLSKYWLIESEL